MSYQPLHDKIVVKLVNETEVRASGLHIPVANTSNTTAKQGEVIEETQEVTFMPTAAPAVSSHQSEAAASVQ